MKNIFDENLPIIAVRGVSFFPNTELKIEVGRENSKQALLIAERFHSSNILVVTQKNIANETPKENDLNLVGVIAKIKMKMQLPNGHFKVVFEGFSRGEILEFQDSENYFQAKVASLQTSTITKDEEDVYRRKLQVALQDFLLKNNFISQDVLSEIMRNANIEEYSDKIAHYLPNTPERKQDYVECLELDERLKMILIDITRENELAKIDRKIDEEIRKVVEQNQKEFYLREKLRIIKEELGDVSNKDEDVDTLRKAISEGNFPERITLKLTEELKRYEMMSSNSPEANIIRSYIDLLISLPWDTFTTDNEDLKNASDLLDASHFGLDKVKERILEYLAVKQLTKSVKSPILCLVGPPGVGKTSLAVSVANALGKNFVKMSLGGVKDESEIRGHRRTYIGAMPGRIVQGMKKAKSTNPLFLFDEIDKMGGDYKGDPSSAMLEVLDPEQNSHFSDHYLEEEFDLSNVMFVATANDLYSIPGPLRDRLEVIEIPGYTELEKLHIASNHLVKKQVESNGIESYNVTFEQAALKHIVVHYTREAGVRTLERQIGKVCRKLAKELLIDKKDSSNVNIELVEKYLGAPRFSHGLKEKEPQVGVVTALAYTQFGGDIFPIETTYFAGKGKIITTGSLGKVMEESAKIAISYIRANAVKFGVDATIFDTNDIHIHVPEGGVPKDGPSAGVTLTTSIISALTKRPVRNDVAMTGEITLRGNVLPIGGLKEKSISALRGGITTIYFPFENKKDLEEVPQDVLEQINFVPVENYSLIFDQVLLGN